MKKRLVLKTWVKDLIVITLFLSICLPGAALFKDRTEKIESGEMRLVYQYGGDL